MNQYEPFTLPPSSWALRRAHLLYDAWAAGERERSHSGIPQVPWCHLVDADRKRWAQLVLLVIEHRPVSSASPNIEPPALDYT